ncbi:MAG TPA: OmpA family protein [Blastocatellia bacterium]|nr:OmpA family protein [Blastocatellia bacterium]
MRRTILFAVVGLVVTLVGSSCATKKYVRERLNERVTPLENRTGELEETSRRNTQEINRLSRDIQEVRTMASNAQQQAEKAASSAEQANTRVTGVEQSVADIKANIDKYSLQKTVTILFDVNRSELTDEARATLDDLAGQIKDRNGFILEIAGFASSDGPAALNEKLSQERCEAVKRYFAERHDVPLFRMSILGFGTSKPVADNADPDGRKMNRRVEIRLLTSSLGAK